MNGARLLQGGDIGEGGARDNHPLNPPPAGDIKMRIPSDEVPISVPLGEGVQGEVMKANKENLCGYNKRLQPFAKRLRKGMTKAEACLWNTQ